MVMDESNSSAQDDSKSDNHSECSYKVADVQIKQVFIHLFSS